MDRLRRILVGTATILVVVTVLALAAAAVWQAGRRTLIGEMQRRLLGIASLAAARVSGDLVEHIRTPDDVLTLDFWRVQDVLARVKSRWPDILYVYILRYRGHGVEWEFVADAATTAVDTDHDGRLEEAELPSLPGDSYLAESDHLELTLSTLRPNAKMEFVEVPPWGSLASAFAPITTSDGRVVGILGIDMAENVVVGNLRQLRWAVILAFSTIGGLLLLVGALFVRLRRMYREAVRLQRQLVHVTVHLAKFVPGSVLQRIQENPEAPELDKVARDVTVLFLDVEGYTRLSELLPAERLRLLVESYFSSFLDLIQANGGDVNETAGDGLMVIFQSEDPKAHALHAVYTAEAIQAEVERLNAAHAAQHDPVSINIGISSGTAEVGSNRFSGVTGERWTFTATGSVTNLAARLSGLATHGDVLVSPETAARVRDIVALVPIGEQRLKNISKPVAVFRLAREGRGTAAA